MDKKIVFEVLFVDFIDDGNIIVRKYGVDDDGDDGFRYDVSDDYFILSEDFLEVERV